MSVNILRAKQVEDSSGVNAQRAEVPVQRDFRRLSRESLIRIIYQLQKENVQMGKDLASERENSQLRADVVKAQRILSAAQAQGAAPANGALANNVVLSERFAQAGNIAEASLALFSVFEAAQAAADRYVQEVAASSAANEAARQEAAQIIANAQRQAQQIVAEAEAERERVVAQTDEMLEQVTLVLDETTNAVEQKWKELETKMETFLQTQDNLLLKG